MCNAQPLSHSSPLFYQLNILTIYQLNQFQIAIFMYSYFKGSLPSIFDNIFNLNCAIHQHKTRAHGNVRLPLYKYNFSRTTITFVGSKGWNMVPNELKLCPTLSNFKKKFKSYILLCNHS